MTHHRTRKWVLGAALVLGSLAALADDPAPRPHGPPPEALQACGGIQEGAACSFTMGDKAVTGTCRTGPDGQTTACMPAHHRGPPPEAFQACQGLAEGASCSVTFHGQDMAGTCRTGPDGQGALACAPARMPPAH
jgi:hypothetical protein